MQPFAELRATLDVLGRMADLRRLDPDAAACLDRAFGDIRHGRLALSHFGTEPELFWVEVCGWLIFVSDLGTTGVLVGLTLAEGLEDQL